MSPTVKGALALVAGTLLLVWPSPVMRTVEIVFGIALLAHAALDVIDLPRRDGGPGMGWRILEIAAEAGVAALVLGRPGLSQVAFLYAVGIAAVLLGAIEAASLSSGEHTTRDRWLGGAVGGAAFAFGMAMIGSAQRDVHVAITVVGIYLVVVGVLRFVRAGHPTRNAKRTPAVGATG